MLQRIKQELKEGRTLLTFSFLRATGQALGMIAPLVVAKFFSPELLGSYYLAKMIVFFFVSLLIASSQTPFIVFANQERTQTGKINKSFSVQCVFLVFSLFIFVLITLLFNKYIMAFAKISRLDLLFVLLAFVGLALKTFLCNLFMTMGQKIKNSLAEFTFGFLSLFLIFVFYFLGMINMQTVFLVYLLSAVILIVLFFRAIDFKLLFPFGLERKSFFEMFNFTRWVFLGTTAAYFIDWGDNLVLRYYSNAISFADIGNYNFGYQLFKGIVVLFSVLGAYFLPFISQNINDAQKIKEYFYSKRPKILLAGIIMLVGAFYVIPFGLGIIYGQTYQSGETVFRILLIAAVMYMYTLFYAPVFNALKKYKFIQIVSAVQVSANVVLDILLVPVFGVYGAAVATVITYIGMAVVYEGYFRIKVKNLYQLT